MRKSLSFVAIAALSLAMPIVAGQFGPAEARARISLNQCISNFNGCISSCVASGMNNPLPPDAPGNAQWGYCQGRCDTNHAACVDLAMSSNASTPPKRKPLVPAANILETSPGLSPQGPSGMGTPGQAPAAPKGPVIR
jgi:hypothetical protein